VVGSTYALTGLCVGIAGVMTASQLSTAQADLDPTIVFDVLTVVVVGGTSLTGGVGSMWRTFVGLALLATIANGMNLLNISPYAQDIVKGVIIVGALALDRVAQRLSSLVRDQ
jgi:ribose transport system permease protein